MVIFLDELDQIPDRSGLGSLLKSVGNASFVLIGIGDNLPTLVKDHQSVGRKLSAVELPVLSPSESRWIFKRAEQVAKGNVKFTESFVEAVVKESYGFPHLLQKLGYRATEVAQKRAFASIETVSVDLPDLEKAFDHILKETSQQDNLPAELSEPMGNARKDILALLAESSVGLSEDAIRKQVPVPSKRHIESEIQALCDDTKRPTLLKKDNANRYWFRDPVARIVFRHLVKIP